MGGCCSSEEGGVKWEERRASMKPIPGKGHPTESFDDDDVPKEAGTPG